ncbi:MAG: aminotransferase class IV [Pirellulaceae bacterium]|nr:aminotransferase class IV [Pirellulaceae bacterium]
MDSFTVNRLTAFSSGKWCRQSDLSIDPNDIGFIQGVTVAERLRTFGGKTVFALKDHLDRLFQSLSIISLTIDYSFEELTLLCHELLSRNQLHLGQNEDVGLTILVTPGPPATQENPHPGTKLLLFLSPLPYHHIYHLYQNGQPLVISPQPQIPAECWPAALKCRSRMHYYLADQFAQQKVPGAKALLLDQQGNLCETSTANIVLYSQDQGLFSPSKETILPGISLAHLEKLAAKLNIPFTYKTLTTDDLYVADEIFLCSTSPCIYPVVSIDQKEVSLGKPGKVFRTLLDAWSESVGTDLYNTTKSFAF